MDPEDARGRPRILWIKTELLHPVDKGGRIRTLEMLRRLKATHHVTYLTLDDLTATPDDRARASEYCDDLVCVPHRLATRGSALFYLEALLNLASPLPYAIARYRNRAMTREIVRRAPLCDVVVCDFLVSAVNMPSPAPWPKVLFQHNVEAEIWRRHALNRKGAAARRFFARQQRRMEVYERDACRSFDSVVAVSQDDCELMRRAYGLPRVDWVPTGVDTQYFTPGENATPETSSLVFTGSMDWLPNEDAIRWFLDAVMPLIKARVSDARLIVVGRNPGKALKDIAASRDDVVVTGRVDDVRPYVRAARVFVAPIRIGGGTRLKIYEAMAMGKPVVSTTIGAEGLPLAPGRDLLIADDPGQFAAAVVEALQNDSLAEAISRQALAIVRENFGWDRVAEKFAAFCTAAAQPHAAVRRSP